MATINPHTTRAPGTILTATIYNNDHENHITNVTAVNDQLEGIDTLDPSLTNNWTADQNMSGITATAGNFLDRDVDTSFLRIFGGPSADSNGANIVLRGSAATPAGEGFLHSGSNALTWTSVAVTIQKPTSIHSTSAVGYGSTGTDIWAGWGGANTWAVGNQADLSSFTNRFFEVQASETLSRNRFKVGSSGSPWLDVVSGTTTLNGGLALTGVITGASAIRGDGADIVIGPAPGSAVTGLSVFIRPSGTGTAAVETVWNANGDMTVNGDITATSGNVFVGNGSSLTNISGSAVSNIPAGNITSGTLANARLDSTVWRDGDQPTSTQIRALVNGWGNGQIDSLGAGAIPGTSRLKILTDSVGTQAMQMSMPNGGIAITFRDNNQDTVGSITIDAGANTTAYNTSSDERLKDFKGEYSPAEAIAIIKADPVRRFSWKKNDEEAIGWGAQTSYKVSSDLASPGLGEPEDEEFQPWGIDQGKRTPYLWAALSWCIERIEELEARAGK